MPHRTCLNALPRPCASATPNTAPITACELDTGTNGIVGNPTPDSSDWSVLEEKMNKTNEWATTTTHAATGLSGIKLLPTVSITRRE